MGFDFPLPWYPMSAKHIAGGPRYAIVALPLPDLEALGDARLVRWLQRAHAERLPLMLEPIDAVATLMGMTVAPSGRAALRFFGQTGDRPAAWMAAADPVYLEPRLDHLLLHAIAVGDLRPGDQRALFDHLQSTLAGDNGAAFTRVGAYAYLRADRGFPTAAMSAAAIDRRLPNEYMPFGSDADGFRRIVSEIEMALHEHPVNIAREATGRFPVNSLWLWGGGLPSTPERVEPALPVLFADEPLCLGYWRLNAGRHMAWPGDIAACLAAARGSFVAVLPAAHRALRNVEAVLSDLRRALLARDLDEIRLAFADGTRLKIRRWQRLRFWQRAACKPEAMD